MQNSPVPQLFSAINEDNESHLPKLQ